MRCSAVGYHHIHDSSFQKKRPGGSSDWLLLLVKTPAQFIIEGEIIHAKANSYMIYSLDTPQHYGADGADYIDDWLHFYPDPEELELFQALSIPLNRPVYIGNIAAASAIIRNMCFEFYSAHLCKQESVTLYFRMMLYKFHEQEAFRYSDTILTLTRHMPHLLWIRESIFRWPEQEWSADVLAREMQLSQSRFLHLYKEAFGSTMLQDITDSRIQKGCELLRTTNLKLPEIADACGYASVPYFIMQTVRKLRKALKNCVKSDIINI